MYYLYGLISILRTIFSIKFPINASFKPTDVNHDLILFSCIITHRRNSEEKIKIHYPG